MPDADFPAVEYDLTIHDGEVLTVFRARDSGIRLVGDGIEWRIVPNQVRMMSCCTSPWFQAKLRP